MTKVLTDVAEGVMVMTINRPAVKNAVDREVSVALAEAVDVFEARDDLSVAVITGAEGTFCSGMDLKAFASGERPSLPGRGFAGIVERPPSKPLIAAVEGWALAGGCELALSADLVIAARDAKFGIPEVKRGLVAAAGGLLRLPKVISYQQAMRLALTGEPLTAQRAHELGLVCDLAEPGEALAAAKALAATIAANGPLAVRASKQIIAASVRYTDPRDFALQRDIANPVVASQDAQEGARAFAEKREPVWTGK